MSQLIQAITRNIAHKQEQGLQQEAIRMQDTLDAAVAEARMPDMNMVRIAMTRQVGLKWRAKAAHKPEALSAATPLLTKTLEEAAFKDMIAKQNRVAKQESGV